MRLDKSFYEKSALDLAKDLLGKVLVHEINGETLKGIIVETEAYIGAIDKASHAYGGKITPSIEALYKKPGTIYVYSVYGMYTCFNIIAGKEGEAEGVLIRAIEPIKGINTMSLRRFNFLFNNLNKTQKRSITNGPAKLCIAMGIDKSYNCASVIRNDTLYVEENPNYEFNYEVVEAKRVGIDYAEEAVDFLWRFYIKDNFYVSKK